MSMLAFFPWFKVREELSYDGFRLIPYERGAKPFGLGHHDQKILDSVMKPYVDTIGRPISSAALVQLAGKEIFREYSDDERDDLFLFSEIVAFSGLAERKYFARQNLNRDDFAFVIQAFPESGSEIISISTRTRDGRDTKVFTAEVYRVQQPFHVNGCSVNLNGLFVNALLQASKKDFWACIVESIFWFNHANTDASTIREQAEIVMIVGAIERLFDCRRGREDDVASSVKNLFPPFFSMLPNNCDRHQTAQGNKYGVTETWVRDLFQLRGDFAHGRQNPSARPRMWEVHEHLLLSSYFFPLLAKLYLRGCGLYELSPEDIRDINAFESLVCARLFEKPVDHSNLSDWPWARIKRDFLLQALVEKQWETISSRQRKLNDK